jgi:hypothetical protein
MAQQDAGWFDRFVDDLPERWWFQFLSKHVVLPYWVWREGKPKLPGGPRPSPQPTENLQRMMNLVMPLKDPSPIGRARMAMVIAGHADEIFSGVDNVGTVHFARFLLIGDNLCMISVYDGDFSNYIRDFIATIGSMFDDVMELVEDGDEVWPTEQNIEKFIDWVHARDLFQVPDFPTDLFALQDAQQGLPPDSPPHELRSLSRAMILQFHANPNVSLGGGYRGYPGVSAAQVRQKMGVGW